MCNYLHFVHPSTLLLFGVFSLYSLIIRRTQVSIQRLLFQCSFIPCDCKCIMAIAEIYGNSIIEEVAESIGSRLNAQVLGIFGCFSVVLMAIR